MCFRVLLIISCVASFFIKSTVIWLFFFFFQAEDGIRDIGVTGVQTCALPIYQGAAAPRQHREARRGTAREDARGELGAEEAEVRQAAQGGRQLPQVEQPAGEIGRASCRERV